MRGLVQNPPADFTAVNQAAFASLSVQQAAFTAGTLQTTDTTATEPITERLGLKGTGTVTIKSALHLVQAGGRWLVRWSPATIAPQLGPGDQLSLQKTWPTRAAILGTDGAALTTQGQVVTIGVEGLRVKDASAVQAALVSVGATAGQASSAIAAAKAHPTYFEPVFTVSRARYDQIQATIYPIPGTVFKTGTARSAITPGLAAGLVGDVGPITAQELGQLGAPYDAQSVVGQTGLEQADEKQLAGAAGSHGHRGQQDGRDGRDAGHAAAVPGNSGPDHNRPFGPNGRRGGAGPGETERRAGRRERHDRGGPGRGVG